MASCEKTGAKDESYDLVIANHVLFYCKNVNKALDEIVRVLKPGGVLVCLSLIHISEPTRRTPISYAVFCLKKKKKKKRKAKSRTKSGCRQKGGIDKQSAI